MMDKPNPTPLTTEMRALHELSERRLEVEALAERMSQERDLLPEFEVAEAVEAEEADDEV